MLAEASPMERGFIDFSLFSNFSLILLPSVAATYLAALTPTQRAETEGAVLAQMDPIKRAQHIANMPEDLRVSAQMVRRG